MRKTKYDIGDWVFCSNFVTFTWDGTDTQDSNRAFRVLKFHPVMFVGQICGATYKSVGELIRNKYPNMHGGYYYGRTALKISKTYLVYKVTRGMTNNPVYVLPEDISASSSNFTFKLPF